MENYIEYKKKLYSAILEFVENYEESPTNLYNEQFKILTRNLTSKRESGSFEEMDQFLQIIKSISEQHHRDGSFINNIKQILKHYQEQIKQTMSNIDIFHIFENDNFEKCYYNNFK